MMKMYKRVALNIYRDGNSFRVLIQNKGKRTSKNFATKKEAMEFRNKCYSKMKRAMA